VRVFLNGTAVIQDSTASQSANSGEVTRSYTVLLDPGVNPLRVTASSTNDISSDAAVASASITANIPPPRPTLHAIVVGIQDFSFKHQQYNLNYSVADAGLFADTLEKKSAGLFDNKLDIKRLITPAETDRAHLIQALTAMQSAIRPGDEFIFYVASHGVVSEDGKYYLLTSNVASFEATTLKRDAIGVEELTELLTNIHTTRKVVFIDTCNAEALGVPLQQALLAQGMSAPAAVTILGRTIGTVVLAATAVRNDAIEGYKGHGLFTYVVTQGLAGVEGAVVRPADKDGTVSNFGLANYVGAEIPRLASTNYNEEQTPIAEVHGQRFPITKVK
jgi:uncharacterized caspase-like protein